MREIVNYRNNTISGTKRKWSSVMSRFRKIVKKSEKSIYYYERIVSQGGSRIHKLQKVNDFVVQEYVCARNNHLAVHDIDIQIWAMTASKLYELENFTSSHSYVARFKRRNSIKSRKYTKLVSKVYETNVENIGQMQSNLLLTLNN
jgi:hypothetical protein